LLFSLFVARRRKHYSTAGYYESLNICWPVSETESRSPKPRDIPLSRAQIPNSKEIINMRCMGLWRLWYAFSLSVAESTIENIADRSGHIQKEFKEGKRESA
jgi:hypothetical protein